MESRAFSFLYGCYGGGAPIPLLPGAAPDCGVLKFGGELPR